MSRAIPNFATEFIGYGLVLSLPPMFLAKLGLLLLSSHFINEILDAYYHNNHHNVGSI